MSESSYGAASAVSATLRRVTRSDWLLAFLGAPGRDLDQIRVMKGMFLLSREGPAELRDLYHFEPYHWGPFDKAVYSDLDLLEARGLIASEPVPGTNRRTFRVTSAGRSALDDLRPSFPQAALSAVEEAKSRVADMGFNELLRYVYVRHPDYAVKSQHR